MATGTSSDAILGMELEDRSRTAKKFWQERRAMFSMSVDEVEEDADTELQARSDKPAAPEATRKPAMAPCKTMMMTNSRRMSLDMGTSMAPSQDTSGRRAPRGSERRKLQRAFSCVQPPKWPIPLGECGEQEAAVDPSKALEAGIVCSDEDLQSILGETSQGQAASSRRQKLRGSRSLSLDSSFFKLKRAHTETHAWFSKILSMQRGEKDKEQGTGQEESDNNVAGVPSSLDGDSSACSSVQQANSDTFVLVQDEPQSPRRSYSSMSSSSEEEDKVSLLAVTTEEEQHAPPAPRIGQQQKEDTSKVLWDESSLVDAGLLGHAIESYLTTTTSTPVRKHSVPGGPRDNVAVSAALKGLFVKLIH